MIASPKFPRGTDPRMGKVGHPADLPCTSYATTLVLNEGKNVVSELARGRILVEGSPNSKVGIPVKKDSNYSSFSDLGSYARVAMVFL